MANTITTQVKDSAGNIYASGVYVIHPTHLSNSQKLQIEGKVVVQMVFFKNEATYNAAIAKYPLDIACRLCSIRPVNESSNDDLYDLVVDVTGITVETEVFTKCQEAVTAKLEEWYGEEYIS